MAFKFVAFAALIAVARAGLAPIAAPVAYAAPLAKTVVAAPLAKTLVAAPVAKAVVSEEYDPNPQYTFGYDVQDGLTGDSKSQVESRNGDVVQGSYSVVDPDGTKRTVDYTADPVNGFNAVVHKEPLVAKAVVAAPAIAKVAAPISYAAPLAAKIAAPISYSAPLAAPLAYSAPVAKLAAPLAPIAKIAAPVAPLAYAAPAAYAAPVAKLAAPLAYSTSVIH
ncbi:larval cuticle protein A3A-like [Rhynchophorus ferrugineus]|uniref:larval cuticle protein A3A-like n=1 Tax=Rhynchophorus ferrugineus TaxID=354439 RepID=UPI003FCD8E7F